jgi:hypothetical protein
MKRLFVLFFGLMLTLSVKAQNNLPPFNSVGAYQQFNALMNMPINNIDQARFFTDRSVEFVRVTPLYVEHVFALCQRLNRDNQKLRISKRSYNSIVNKNQFGLIYDVFNKFSVAIELYHFVQQNDFVQPIDPVIPLPPIHQDPFVGEQKFSHLIADLRSIPFSRQRYERAKLIIQNERLNMNQFERIFIELKDSSYLFNLLKFSLPIVPNPDRMYKYKNWLRFNSERRAFEELLLNY